MVIAMNVPVLHAWVDESAQGRGGQLADGIYLLAATVADPTRCDVIRDALRGLIARGSQRLHWVEESEKRRRLIAEAIAEHEVLTTVVIASPLDPRRQERARRRCMERLYYELERMHVEHVWIESRHPSLNRRDLQMIASLRQTGAVSAELRFDFIRPYDEPMLWVPDAVAGAVGAARKWGSTDTNQVLAAGLEEIDVDMS
jgi:hypothetical protein